MGKCLECENEARHWNSSFCEECFTVILNEKLAATKKEDEVHE